MNANLLPRNSTAWERAVAGAVAFAPVLGDAIALSRTAKWKERPLSYLPFIVYELGLGELTPYVTNLYALIDEGVSWQRLRGTPAALAQGMGWLSLTASLDEAWSGRRWWNSYQLRFTALPANDSPLLEQIEGVAMLSTPKRSQLRRGVHAYDAGAVELDGTVLDNALVEQESGVAVTDAGTLWSFGRSVAFEHTLTEAEGLAIGNWLPPVEETELLWKDIGYSWVDAHFLWAASPAAQRRSLLAGWFAGRVLYVVFKDASNAVLGYRRCRAVRAVKPAFNGAYLFSGTRFAPSASGERLYIDAMTDFADADGVIAVSVGLVVNAALAEGVASGKLWLEPDELESGTVIAETPVSLPLRTTVREQITMMMRF